MDLANKAVSRTLDAPIGQVRYSDSCDLEEMYLELAMDHGTAYANRIALSFGISKMQVGAMNSMVETLRIFNK